MALVNCADCQTEMSNLALACPKCGRPNYVPAQPSAEPMRKVTVEDIDMPFFSMVAFMLKWGVATVPAILGLGMIWFFLGGFFASLVAHH